jgi:Zn-dependent metalloprotease
MKSKFTISFFLFSVITNLLFAREIKGMEAQQKIKGAEKIILTDNTGVPQYVQFRKDAQFPLGNFESWARSAFNLSAEYSFQLLNSEKDGLGMVHYRYQQTWNGYPLVSAMMIVHTKNNAVLSVDGLSFNKINAATAATVTEGAALNKALNHTNASVYRWQVPQMESVLKKQTNNPQATFYPKGELMLAPVNGNYLDNQYRLAYRFDVYSVEPLKREYVFVDALTGEVIYTLNRIHTSNSQATAVTGYRGNRTIATDSVNATSYRLRETTRGLGVETYNLQQSTNYNNTDFTDVDNYWNNVNAAEDQYATDAHYGAEMTYDFYKSKFNRNSIDDAGMMLYSYVHYSTNYVNAFWDGNEMTYGDGNATYTPLTSLEIAGHEISHGVTERTSGLNYANESGAMNEAFSDCMGNSIRYFGDTPASINWLIGDEIGGTPFRNMANPNQYQNPDCYGGLYWNNPNEVHNNSGVMNFWYYLLTEGGTGTNDLGNAYNVTGLGIDKAAAICYRMNTVYLFPNSVYADARTYAIQAAQDLYGGCSPEVIATANAWYAAGVGGPYDPTVVSSFTAGNTSFCSLPASVTFNNTSTNGSTYVWHFGDGDTSSSASPTHIYTAPGQYSVTLDVDGGPCGNDTHTATNFVDISLPVAPTATDVTICPNFSTTLTASGSPQIIWYDAPTAGNQLATGTSYTTPSLATTTTYYIESRITPAPQHAAALDNTFGAGGYFTNTNYHNLIFDVYTSVNLVSVNVYTGAAGNRTFTLIDNAGDTLQTITSNLVNGLNTVTLNWPLYPGTGFMIGCSGTVNLYRNSAGASFPYTLNGVLSITGTNATNTGYYYYFYDWVVQGAACVSLRTPVTVTVSNVAASYSTTVVGNSVDFFDLSTGNIVSWHWDFGDGDTSNLQSPTHVFASLGTYHVCLTITDVYGCRNTTCQDVPIIDLGIHSAATLTGISIYPNPVNNSMFIRSSASDRNLKLTLTDVIGQTVGYRELKEASSGALLEWNLSSLAPGSYTLIIENERGMRMMKRIVRQ